MKYKLRSGTASGSGSGANAGESSPGDDDPAASIDLEEELDPSTTGKKAKLNSGVAGGAAGNAAVGGNGGLGAGPSCRRKPRHNPSHRSIETQTDSGGVDDDEVEVEEHSGDGTPIPSGDNLLVHGKTGNGREVVVAVAKRKRTELEERTPPDDDSGGGQSCPMLRLPSELVLHVMKFLDTRSILALYRSNRWHHGMLSGCNQFWRLLCVREEFANYQCIAEPSNYCSCLSSAESVADPCASKSAGTSRVTNPSGLPSILDASKELSEEAAPSNPKEEPLPSGAPPAKIEDVQEQARNTEDHDVDVPVLEPAEDDGVGGRGSSAPEEPWSGETHRLQKLGFASKPMHVHPPNDLVPWRKVFLRGLQMRRNVMGSNFEGWRIYANTAVPVVGLRPDLDVNTDVRRRMGNYPKLSMNDDLKIDWDDRHLVVFHFFRGAGESCTVRVWDIEGRPNNASSFGNSSSGDAESGLNCISSCASSPPRFLFAAEKGIGCITDKVFVVNGHVVLVPSWPLEADAVVLTLRIDEAEGTMPEAGKFRFEAPEHMTAVDENWEHTQLRVVRDTAMVVMRAPDWQCLIVGLPTCELRHNIVFDAALLDLFDCQQIRSYKTTAMILFNHKQESINQLVTIDVGNGGSSSNESTAVRPSGPGLPQQQQQQQQQGPRLRSVYQCMHTVDVALFTDPEEIYLMKRTGDVVVFDPNTNTETFKIVNSSGCRNSPHSEYQLFVNRKEQICVMQSAAEVPEGRHIRVYSYDAVLQYTINLDVCRYGMSRDESICIYTNRAFLAAADSKKFVIFRARDGRFLGEIHIPPHLERSKGKEEKFCMFEQTGLSLFIFDEDKLIAVHDYERSFPAVLDIYKFW